MGTGGDNLTAAVVIGRDQPRGGDAAQRLVGCRAHYRRHARRCAGARSGHRFAAASSERDRVLGSEHSGDRRSRQFPDTVPGDHQGQVLTDDAEMLADRHTERNDERLCDLDVLERFGAPVRTQLNEIDAARLAVRPQLRGDVGHLQPRPQHAGTLSALAGGEYRNH